MTNRVPENSRGNPRLTPLMVQSFSRLLSSAGSSNSSSFNHTGDSGYLSSFISSNNSTPSTEPDSSSHLYCSTPVASGSLLSQQTTILSQTSDQTPVSRHPGTKHMGCFSEDRIPRPSPSLSNQATDCLEIEADDVLSCLIKSSAPAVRLIFQYLSNEDLLRLCQVCDTFCRAVCDQQPTLKRLSKFLISINQNAENRTTPNLGVRSFGVGDVLRPVENVLNFSPNPGAVWTIPSPLESVDLKKIPTQLRSLITMTKGLSSNYCVASCHTCRRLMSVRLYQNHKAVACSTCLQQASKTSSSSSRVLAVPKNKKTLFPNLR